MTAPLNVAGPVGSDRTTGPVTTRPEVQTSPPVGFQDSRLETGDPAVPGTERAFTPAPQPLVVVAYGKPITQGSKTKNRWGAIYDDNAAVLKPWREAVKTAAIDVMRGNERLTGPVSVVLLCYFDRPSTHYRTGRNAHLLRDNAPLFPANVRSGDIDKIQRSCFDSLTDAGVFVDDSQIVHVTAWKLWTGEHADALPIPGVRIEIRPMTVARTS